MKLLIAGGNNDPNLTRLIDAAKKRSIQVILLLTDSLKSPAFSWSIETNRLSLGNSILTPGAAFVRRNVFHKQIASQHDRSLAWYTSVTGYLLAHPEIKTLNQSYLEKYTNKLYVLHLAKNLGLTIPETVITNVPDDFRFTSKESAVAKPVAGGGYCEEVEHLAESTELRSSVTANPAIVQEKIKGDDIRFFRIGERFLGFRIESDKLDYRKSGNPKVEFLPDLPENTIFNLKNLMDKMELNWGAADFKFDKSNEEYVFLEVNSNPMFSVFDNVCSGQISNSILSFLSA